LRNYNNVVFCAKLKQIEFRVRVSRSRVMDRVKVTVRIRVSCDIHHRYILAYVGTHCVYGFAGQFSDIRKYLPAFKKWRDCSGLYLCHMSKAHVCHSL